MLFFPAHTTTDVRTHFPELIKLPSNISDILQKEMCLFAYGQPSIYYPITKSSANPVEARSKLNKPLSVSTFLKDIFPFGHTGVENPQSENSAEPTFLKCHTCSFLTLCKGEPT